MRRVLLISPIQAIGRREARWLISHLYAVPPASWLKQRKRRTAPHANTHGKRSTQNAITSAALRAPTATPRHALRGTTPPSSSPKRRHVCFSEGATHVNSDTASKKSKAKPTQGTCVLPHRSLSHEEFRRQARNAPLVVGQALHRANEEVLSGWLREPIAKATQTRYDRLACFRAGNPTSGSCASSIATRFWGRRATQRASVGCAASARP